MSSNILLPPMLTRSCIHARITARFHYGLCAFNTRAKRKIMIMQKVCKQRAAQTSDVKRRTPDHGRPAVIQCPVSRMCVEVGVVRCVGGRVGEWVGKFMAGARVILQRGLREVEGMCLIVRLHGSHTHSSL